MQESFEIIENQQPIAEVEQSSRNIGLIALKGSVVGLAAASWAFQIGPWNEALRVDQGTKVLEDTLSATGVALTVGGITAGVELTSASLIAAGLNSGNKLTDWLKKRKKGKKMLEEAEEAASTNDASYGFKDLATDIGLSMGAGAGVVTVRHHLKEDNPRLSKDLMVGAIATVPVTALSGFVGYTAAQSIITGGESDWFASDLIVDYGTSNKFWMSLLAVFYGAVYAKKGLNHIRQKINKKKISEFGNIETIDNEESPIKQTPKRKDYQI